MSYYVHGKYPTYEAYLDLKARSHGLVGLAQEQTLQIVASRNELAEHGLKLTSAVNQFGARIDAGLGGVNARLDDLSSTMREGFVGLQYELENVNENIGALSTNVEHGFMQIESQMNALDTSLKELRKIAKTPEQTWAYEQYDIAVDAFRKRLYQEAHEHLLHAINGFQGHTGYKIDHRFHHLLGRIHRCDYPDYSPQLLDLDKAYNAYATAARYAQLDYPSAAAQALCEAAYTAYIRQDPAAAERDLKAAIQLDPRLPLPKYLLAKVYCNIGQLEAAAPLLREAVLASTRFGIAAGMDDDLRRLGSNIDQILASARDAIATDISACATLIKGVIDRYDALHKDGDVFKNIVRVRSKKKSPPINPISSSNWSREVQNLGNLLNTCQQFFTTSGTLVGAGQVRRDLLRTDVVALADAVIDLCRGIERIFEIESDRRVAVNGDHAVRSWGVIGSMFERSFRISEKTQTQQSVAPVLQRASQCIREATVIRSELPGRIDKLRQPTLRSAK